MRKFKFSRILKFRIFAKMKKSFFCFNTIFRDLIDREELRPRWIRINLKVPWLFGTSETTEKSGCRHRQDKSLVGEPGDGGTRHLRLRNNRVPLVAPVQQKDFLQDVFVWAPESSKFRAQMPQFTSFAIVLNGSTYIKLNISTWI